jgi:hypothetical protein
MNIRMLSLLSLSVLLTLSTGCRQTTVVASERDVSNPVCGNGLCEAGEDQTSCAADCPVVLPGCGNGVCEADEAAASCPNDCAVVPLLEGACPAGVVRQECALDQVNDAALRGAPGGLTGTSATFPGDLDGDGIDDLVIADPRFRAGESLDYAGAVYVFYGRTAGWESLTSVTQADAILVGDRYGGTFGEAVAGAGDVDGDGYADLVVGASGDEGRAWLLLGGAGRWSGTHTLDSETGAAPFRAVLLVGTGGAGCAVAGAGDVDGDGLDDVLVGACKGSAAHLVYGRADWGGPAVSLAEVGATLIDTDPNRNVGWRVAGAGDLDGDGLGDLVVGAPEHYGPYGAGRVYVLYGRATRLSGTLELPTTADAEVRQVATDPPLSLGIYLAGGFDLDGDGRPDLVIGADEHLRQRRAHLFYGAAERLSGVVTLDRADAVITGPVFAGNGAEVASAGDVNGDGHDDLLLAAGRVVGGEGKNVAYLFLGGPLRFSGEVRVQGAAAVFYRQDESETVSWMGSHVAGGGDVDGDGLSDLLIGDVGHHFGGSAAGTFFLVQGRD